MKGLAIAISIIIGFFYMVIVDPLKMGWLMVWPLIFLAVWLVKQWCTVNPGQPICNFKVDNTPRVIEPGTDYNLANSINPVITLPGYHNTDGSIPCCKD